MKIGTRWRKSKEATGKAGSVESKQTSCVRSCPALADKTCPFYWWHAGISSFFFFFNYLVKNCTRLEKSCGTELWIETHFVSFDFMHFFPCFQLATLAVALTSNRHSWQHALTHAWQSACTKTNSIQPLAPTRLDLVIKIALLLHIVVVKKCDSSMPLTQTAADFFNFDLVCQQEFERIHRPLLFPCLCPE